MLRESRGQGEDLGGWGGEDGAVTVWELSCRGGGWGGCGARTGDASGDGLSRRRERRCGERSGRKRLVREKEKKRRMRERDEYEVGESVKGKKGYYPKGCVEVGGRNAAA